MSVFVGHISSVRVRRLWIKLAEIHSTVCKSPLLLCNSLALVSTPHPSLHPTKSPHPHPPMCTPASEQSKYNPVIFMLRVHPTVCLSVSGWEGEPDREQQRGLVIMPSPLVGECRHAAQPVGQWGQLGSTPEVGLGSLWQYRWGAKRSTQLVTLSSYVSGSHKMLQTRSWFQQKKVPFCAHCQIFIFHGAASYD